MGLESVGDFVLHISLTNLSPEDVSRVACVSKRFRSSASEDSLWFRVCSQEPCVTNPVDLLGNPVPSFKVRASAVFIPELADLLDHREKYLFFYSIRMFLQPQGCIINGMFFNS